eukprot:5615666-Amphidinium_carterae.1
MVSKTVSLASFKREYEHIMTDHRKRKIDNERKRVRNTHTHTHHTPHATLYTTLRYEQERCCPNKTLNKPCKQKLPNK